MPALTHVGKTALSTASDIHKDISEGRNFKESAQERIKNAYDSLQEQVSKKIRGEGMRKKRKTVKKKTRFKKYVILKKKKFNDIFDE
jgi:Na+/phosphate symporter